MIDVLIVDDHQIVIEGLKLLLESNADISVIGTVNSGHAALDFLEYQPVHLVLLDIFMEGMNGIETCEKITKQFPAIKVLALTTANDTSLIRSMFNAGAKGYLMKNTDKEELTKAIHTLLKGDSFFGEEVSKYILTEIKGESSSSISSIPRISRREKQILQMIVDEMTTAEIAKQLFISFGTVETHRRNIMNKLGARNTAGMVRIALEHGLLN